MSEATHQSTAGGMLVAGSSRQVKCLVWDLDETLWSGTLLQGDRTEVSDRVRESVLTLDSRGILQSVASRNDYELAMNRLISLGLSEYFLFPQIGWIPKSDSIRKIAERLNIGLDTIAFVDDQEFERAEVAHSLPEVLCLDCAELEHLGQRPEFNPRFITEDSRRRRLTFLGEMQRETAEDEFIGPKEAFLQSLQMKFSMAPAKQTDLSRAEELMARTNQMNTTGYRYSYDELCGMLDSPAYRVLVCELEDRFGQYGKIGLAVIQKEPREWVIKLLLMSCRVMNRGVGSVLIRHIISSAQRCGVRLLAEMIPNDRNRIMYMTYKLAGFSEYGKSGKLVIFEHDYRYIQPASDYIEVCAAPEE